VSGRYSVVPGLSALPALLWLRAARAVECPTVRVRPAMRIFPYGNCTEKCITNSPRHACAETSCFQDFQRLSEPLEYSKTCLRSFHTAGATGSIPVPPTRDDIKHLASAAPESTAKPSEQSALSSGSCPRGRSRFPATLESCGRARRA
jgi:hypothetical protein